MKKLLDKICDEYISERYCLIYMSIMLVIGLTGVFVYYLHPEYLSPDGWGALLLLWIIVAMLPLPIMFLIICILIIFVIFQVVVWVIAWIIKSEGGKNEKLG